MTLQHSREINGKLVSTRHWWHRVYGWRDGILAKDDMRFRYQMMAFCFIMGIHFTLMGATVAAIGVIINGIRSFASIKTQSRKVMWFFIALMWLMTLPNITHF